MVAGAVLVTLSVGDLAAWLGGVMPILPYLIYPAGILLCFRFGRGKLMLATLVVAMAERALWFLWIPGDPAAIALRDTLATLIPLNLGLLIVLPEAGTWNRVAFNRLLIVLSEVAVAALIAFPYPAPAARWLRVEILPAPVHDLALVPDPALLIFTAAILLGLWKAWTAPSSTSRGFLWTSILTLLAVSTQVPSASAALMNAAGLVLVLAAIETSYFMAYRDGLTGLPARRALSDALLRLGNRYAIAMVDVDHFKRFNDRHGHDVGDQVLKMVASQLKGVAGGGKPFRYGGEEFAVVFPGKEVDEVVPYLQRLRKNIEDASFKIRNPMRPRKKPDKPRKSGKRVHDVAVTVSIGVAEPDSRTEKPEDVIKTADTILYKAKRAGRNRVRF